MNLVELLICRLQVRRDLKRERPWFMFKSLPLTYTVNDSKLHAISASVSSLVKWKCCHQTPRASIALSGMSDDIVPLYIANKCETLRGGSSGLRAHTPGSSRHPHPW